MNKHETTGGGVWSARRTAMAATAVVAVLLLTASVVLACTGHNTPLSITPDAGPPGASVRVQDVDVLIPAGTYNVYQDTVPLTEAQLAAIPGVPGVSPQTICSSTAANHQSIGSIIFPVAGVGSGTATPVQSGSPTITERGVSLYTYVVCTGDPLNGHDGHDWNFYTVVN